MVTKFVFNIQSNEIYSFFYYTYLIYFIFSFIQCFDENKNLTDLTNFKKNDAGYIDSTVSVYIC